MKYLFILLNLLTNTNTFINNISIDLSANFIQYKYFEVYTGFNFTPLQYKAQGIIEALITIKFIAIGTNLQLNFEEFNLAVVLLLKTFKSLYVQILINPFKTKISFGPTYKNSKQKIATYYTIQFNNTNYNNDNNDHYNTTNNNLNDNAITINNNLNENNSNANTNINESFNILLSNNIKQTQTDTKMISEITQNIIILIQEQKTKIRFVEDVQNNLLRLHLNLQEINIDNERKNHKLKILYNTVTTLYDITLNAILWNKNENYITPIENNKESISSIKLTDKEKDLYQLLQKYLNNIKINYNINIENHINYQLHALFINDTQNTTTTEILNSDNININQKKDANNNKKNTKFITKITSNQSIYQTKQLEINIELKEIIIEIEKMWDIINPCSIWSKCCFAKSDTFSPLHALNKAIRYDLPDIFNNTDIPEMKISVIQKRFKIINENLEKLTNPISYQKHIENITRIPKNKADKIKLEELIPNILQKIENLTKMIIN